MNTLIDVEIDEISLVDEPANAGATILLFKRDSSTAVTSARLALEAVKKALQATKPESEADTMPSTVAACDAAFKALVRQFGNDPVKAADSPAGKELFRRRYEIANRLDRVEKETKPAWAAKVAALTSVSGADRMLDSLAAEHAEKTGKPKARAYADLLKTPIGAAIYARRAELKKAA